VTISVRAAGAADATSIQLVATAAWRDTYAGLLRPETIEAFIAAAYSRESLGRRIAQDTVLVADVDGTVRAFADAIPGEDAVVLGAIYAEPGWRGQGLGSALLEELRRSFAGVPIRADVLVGNRLGERFYEHRGFVPHDDLEAELFGEPVRERRWWLGAPPPVTG
jgi:GNAT superfamily N-acetyltransferase